MAYTEREAADTLIHPMSLLIEAWDEWRSSPEIDTISEVVSWAENILMVMDGIEAEGVKDGQYGRAYSAALAEAERG